LNDRRTDKEFSLTYISASAEGKNLQLITQ
jgi:hypothetical protein